MRPFGIIRKMYTSEQLRFVHHPPSSHTEIVIVFSLFSERSLDILTRKLQTDLGVVPIGKRKQVIQEQQEEELLGKVMIWVVKTIRG
jgi:hypothetical protein